MQISIKKNIWIARNKKNLPLLDLKIFENKNEFRELEDENFVNLEVPNLKKIGDEIISGKKVLIHGDYDVDGICSSAILHKTLKKIGIFSEIILPNRFGGGYGINLSKTIEKLDPETIFLTLDCGTNEFLKFEEISKISKKILVLDHHEPDENSLSKNAIICNPKFKNNFIETKNLVTSGLALKLAIYILEKKNILDQNFLDELFVLASTGTTCDVAPMKYENWQIVRKGLKNFVGKNLGIDELLKISFKKNDEVAIPKITNYHLGFVLGPKINATGRMDSPEKSLKLLISENQEEVEILAKFLSEENKKRQKKTEEAVQKILENFDQKNEKFIFFGSQDFSRGIVGIVASRMMEKTNLPSFIFEENEEFCIGSARSMGQIDLAETLHNIKNSLISGGGHKKAGGFVFEKKKKDEVFLALKNEISKNFKNIPKTIPVDAEIIDFDEKNLINFVKNFEKFEPFGFENSEPKFLIKNLQIESFSIVGKDSKHMRVQFFSKNKIRFVGIFFNFPDFFSPNGSFDILVSLKISQFNGKEKVDFIIEDMRKNLN